MIGINREYEIILYTIARSHEIKAKLFATDAKENIIPEPIRNVPYQKLFILIIS